MPPISDRPARARRSNTPMLNDGGDRDDEQGNSSWTLYINNDLVNFQKLTWTKDKEKNPTTSFRILSEPDYENPGTFFPAREMDPVTGEPQYTGWKQKYDIFVTKGCAFITHDPRDQDQSKFASPGFVVPHAIVRACKEGDERVLPHWGAMTHKDSKTRCLDYPKQESFVYALIYQQGPDYHATPLGLTGKPVLLKISQGPSREITRICNIRAAAYQGYTDIPDNLEDINDFFAVKDPTQIDRSVIFRVWNGDLAGPRHADENLKKPVKIWTPPPPPADAPPKKTGFGYAVYAVSRLVQNPGKSDELRISGVIDPVAAAKLAKRLLPIDDVLHFHTPAEQVVLLCKHLKWKGSIALDVIEYGLESSQLTADLVKEIPEWAWAEFHNKVTVDLAKNKKRAGNQPEDEDDVQPTTSRRTRPAPVEDDDDDDDTPRRSSRVEEEAPKARPKPAKPRDDDEDEDDAPPPSRKRGAKVDESVPSVKVPVAADDDEDEDEDEAPPPKPKRARVQAPVVDENDDEDESPPPKPKRAKAIVTQGDEDDTPPTRAKRGKPSKPAVVTEEEEEEEEVAAPPPKPKKTKAGLPFDPPPAKSRKPAPVPVEDEDEDDDEDDNDAPPPKAAPKPNRPITSLAKKPAPVPVEDEDEDDDDDDDTPPPPRSSAGAAKLAATNAKYRGK